MRTNQPTTMFHAFCKAKATNLTLASLCLASMDRFVKSRKKAPPAKGWSCNLSYRTFRQLTARGVPVQ